MGKSAIPRLKLSKVFAAIKPEYVLGTTYTLSLAFFESVVFQHVKRDHLKRCLIICDQFGFHMAMSEAPALRYAARDYMVATAPSPGTFHAKVWLLLTKTEALLLVGSGNLTQPGFIENIELFDIARIEAGGIGRELAADVLLFLRGLTELWRGTSESNLLPVQTLREIIGAVEALETQLIPTEPAPVRLLSSFAGAFPEQLAPLGAETAYVAAPYFGNSTASLERLQAALGVKRIFVFPSTHADGKLDLPVTAAMKLPGVKVRALAMAAARPEKFAHLKLYGFEAGAAQAWVLTGSINCTSAAMDGPNVEAGLLRRIPAGELPNCFKAADLADEESGSHYSVQPSRSGWLVMWAADVGDQFSVELAAAHRAVTPLSKVTIEVRSAQRMKSIELREAFARGGTEHIAWRHFGDFRSQLRNAAVVRVSGIDTHGREVAGQCLVDDFATLTSDPVHRSAWRAAVALLGAEGMPDFADVVALFNLTDATSLDEDDGELADDVSTTGRRMAGSTKVTRRDKAPVWPPTLLLNESMAVGPYSHGAGNVYWFNRILAAFLSHRASDLGNPTTAEGVDAGDDDKGGDHRDVTTTEAVANEDDEVTRAARRLWQHADDALRQMRERLNELEVDTRNAHRVWGLSAVVFMGVLHVARAIRRSDHLHDSVPTTSSLARTWLAMLLADRDQGDDYAPSVNSVYGERVFPSLAVDLSQRFQEWPHPDVLSIVCLGVAHVLASSQSDRRAPIPVAQWLRFRDLVGDLFQEAIKDEAYLERQWRMYFQDPGEAVTWDATRAAIANLKVLSWSDHRGMRDLQMLEDLRAGDGADGTQALSEFLKSRLTIFARAGFRSVEVSPYSESCENSRCSKYQLESPDFLRLRDLNPVICRVCGCLAVPDALAEALREMNHDRAS